MDGDSIPRCTIAARSLRGVLLRESREYVGVPSPQLVATSVVSHLTQRSGSDSRGQRRKWSTGESAHGEVIAIRPWLRE